MDTSTSRTFTLTIKGKPIKPWQYESYSIWHQGPDRITLEKKLQQRMLTRKYGAEVIAHTNPVNTADSSLDCSFPACIYEAYNHHLHLILRPDDLWLSIMIVFANYASFHSEALRDVLVPFSGPRDVETTHIGAKSIESWMQIISDLANRVPLQDNVREWMIPNFSTTTDQDRAVGQLALLGSMKRYVNYHSSGSCGIPEVTLEGTVLDWSNLLAKVGRIADYGRESGLEELVWWGNLLIDIVGEFVRSRMGIINNDFWQRSVYQSTMCGSGIEGWILAFTPFEEGNWRLNHPNDIAITHVYGEFTNTLAFNNYATVQVPVNVHDSVNCYVVYLYGGAILSSIDQATHTIRPNYDLAVLQIPPETLKIMDEQQAREFVAKPVTALIEALKAKSGLPEVFVSKQHQHPMYLHHVWHCRDCTAYGTTGYKCYQCEMQWCAECARK